MLTPLTKGIPPKEAQNHQSCCGWLIRVDMTGPAGQPAMLHKRVDMFTVGGSGCRHGMWKPASAAAAAWGATGCGDRV